MSSDTVCIQCGQPAGDPLRLNHMPNGRACSACRDRLLDSLPAPFPSPVVRENEVENGLPECEEPEEVEATDEEASSRLRALPQDDSQSMSFEDDGGYKPSA